MKYYTIQKETILIADNKQSLTKFYGNVKALPEDYKKNKYVIEDDTLVLNPNYEEQVAQDERSRLNMLSLTAADVERAIYKAKGLDFDDILELVKDNPEIDTKALKIEFKANNFYRGNPYIEQVGALLGFTPEMLDKFFESGEWEELVGVNEAWNIDDATTPPDEKGEDVEFPSEEGIIDEDTDITNELSI